MACAWAVLAAVAARAIPQAEAPPPLKLEKVEDRNLFQVDKPERFQLTQAVEHLASPELKVTGTVNPDISRAVPVISLATGRVVEIDARLGDTVKKGQVLLKVQSADISGAFSDYQKAMADEQLANTQLERAKILFDRGAISPERSSGGARIRKRRPRLTSRRLPKSFVCWATQIWIILPELSRFAPRSPASSPISR